MNPLFQQLIGAGGAMGQPMDPQPMSPMQRMQMIMNAMRNPAAFLKQKFPDIPDCLIYSKRAASAIKIYSAFKLR